MNYHQVMYKQVEASNKRVYVFRDLMNSSQKGEESKKEFLKKFTPEQLRDLVFRDQDLLDASQLVAANLHPDKPSQSSDFCRLSGAMQLQRNPLASNYNPNAVKEFELEVGPKALSNALNKVVEYMVYRNCLKEMDTTHEEYTKLKESRTRWYQTSNLKKENNVNNLKLN